MKPIIKYFANGLLFLIPVGATIYIVYWIFATVDTLVRDLLVRDPGEHSQWWFAGLGVLITITFIFTVGLLTSLFITRPLTQLVEKLFARTPLIKLLYSSIKDLIGAFVGDKKKFDKPVMVTLIPTSNVKALGFVTRRSMEIFGLQDEVAVYLPQSYNFAGSVLIVPAAQITPLNVDSADVMAFIVSGGVSGHGHQKQTKHEQPGPT